jgi:PadR family transcriptional regulator
MAGLSWVQSLSDQWFGPIFPNEPVARSSSLTTAATRYTLLVDCQEENVMPKPKSDLLQGTLDLLILKTLELQPMHGWGIAQRIQQVSEDVLQVNQGSLYPGLHRLEEQGWIRSSWGASENNRQAKYYELTRLGRKQLADEAQNWERLSTAVGRVLGTA